LNVNTIAGIILMSHKGSPPCRFAGYLCHHFIITVAAIATLLPSRMGK
jgi:hypothetical protein